MQLRSGSGTYRTFAESRLMPPDPAPGLQAGEASPVQKPSRVDAPRPGMTRHTTAPGCVCRLAPELRSPSGSCLQPHDGCDGRRVAIRRSQPSPCPSPPTGPRDAPPRLSGCRKSALTAVPPEIRTELASPSGAGYKMSFSGGFLFRAAGSTGVQDVLFRGVFVPQGWNRQGHQSASRLRPVGAWLRLCHGVPVSC